MGLVAKLAFLLPVVYVTFFSYKFLRNVDSIDLIEDYGDVAVRRRHLQDMMKRDTHSADPKDRRIEQLEAELAAAKGRSFNPSAWWTAARSAVADNAPSAFGFVLLPVIVLFSLRALIPEPVPRLAVTLTEQERRGATGDKWKRGNAASAKWIPCYDPGSLDILGPDLPAMDEKQVRAAIARAAAAQKVWAKSTFRTRRLFLKVLRRFILENQDDICAVSARDSGKPLVDAAFGEVLVTLEKIRWLLREGERWLAPERRSSGAMMFYKSARVEFHPVGVMGAIVPWNYPFHNVFNPLLANLFAGNALVVKVSEHATWSSQYYGRIIDAALEAVGAPAGLVQIITGYAEAGNALVTGGIDKLVFVGSTHVGRKVMEAASKQLTPVVLELGGKDVFIVCDDADLSQAVPMALRGAFQSSGQNCAGAERFYVHEKVHDAFVDGVVSAAKQMRQGHALEPAVDCGAMCMPTQAAFVHELVADAVSKGARIEVGGVLPDQSTAQFYPPTILTGVTHAMRIAREEVFGPVLAVFKVANDDEAVTLANDCDFGLGSNVFSASVRRAEEIGSRLEAGMTSVNDFCATYMAQSLPFGGVKASGFDKFAGIEGLRGCCRVKAVVVDSWPLIKTKIPAPLRYPVAPYAFGFCKALCYMFFAPGLLQKVSGLLMLAKCFLGSSPKSAAQPTQAPTKKSARAQ